MDRLKRLIGEIHRRSLWQVLAIYIGASWVVFEIVQTVTEGLGLPPWFPAFAALLLLIGLPIVLATAFVQEGVAPSNRTDPTLIPVSRQPATAGQSSRYDGGLRRLLTWRRALLGGLLAFALWGVVATAWLLMPDRRRVSDGVPRIQSLVVLPLDNLTGDPGQEYFADGMHEALTAELSKIRALKVISRTSAMHYKGAKQPIARIASELGVDGVIEGSVAREGDRVRITVQLFHGPTDERLWTDTYQRELRSVLALQSEVARAIAEQIQVTLAPREAERLATHRVVDPAAYEDYLMGQFHWNRLTREGWEAAIDHFQRSIDRDPSYAPAHAMMSFAYSYLGAYSLLHRQPPAVLYSRALAAAERAVALDSSLAEAHASLSLVKTFFDWDWSGADRASQEALRLNPDGPMAVYARAWFLSLVGRHDEAIPLAKRAVDLDPVAPWMNTQLGWMYFMARRYDEAIEQGSKVVALEPDYRDAHVVLCLAYAKKGMLEEAATEAQKFEPPHWYAWVLILAERSAEARDVLERILPEDSATPGGAYFLAVVLGELGETDRALDLLELAYERRSASLIMLKVDPRMDALRDDPRFQDLLLRMGFPD